MAATILTIWLEGQSRQVTLDPKGAVIGRDPACGIVLDSHHVSRRHARICRDPFGRWIVEDLASHNGTWINGQRIRARGVGPGEHIRITPFTLSMSENLNTRIQPDALLCTLSRLVDDAAPAQIQYMPARPDVSLSRRLLFDLNAFVDQLAELTGVADLYPTVCRLLAKVPGTTAAAIEVPDTPEPLPASPPVLACSLGSGPPDGSGSETMSLRLSRRVLEAVRTTRNAVVARSSRPGDSQLALTIVNERDPRAVLCIPVTGTKGGLECIYLDVPAGIATDEMMDFAQATARQVNLARKSLLLTEAKAQRRVLDEQLDLAREIQARLVSNQVGSALGLDVAVCYQPVMWVGGDYCDLWMLADGRLAFAVGDVSGKGLPAALVMSNLQAALRIATRYRATLDDVMLHVNEHLMQSTPLGIFVTLFLGLLEPATGRLEYVDAGHGQALLVSSAGVVRDLEESPNTVVGAVEWAFQPQSTVIEPGNGLLIVTDGITESAAPAGEQFGTPRLRATVEGRPVQSAASLVGLVTQAAASFRADLPPRDDITVLALLHNPNP